MDWCLNVYEERNMNVYAGAGRTVRMLLAALAFCMALFWVSAYTAPAEVPAPVREDSGADSGSETAVTVAAAIPGSIVVPVIPSAGPDKVLSNTEEMTAAANEPDTFAVYESPIIPETLIVPEAPAVSDTPAMPDASAEPDTPIMPAAPAVPETPVISDSVSVPDNPENASSSSAAVGGFMVDENGMICGVADSEMAISGGVMKFPSEGCCGISAGAFSDGFPSVLEVYIPANITEIEPGAFAGLVNVEWYTAEPGSGFSDNMGVLLSDNGTNIFAFPCGRTGSYKVPAEITGFSENAFTDANITAIDMTECAAEAPSDLPEYIKVIRREAY